VCIRELEMMAIGFDVAVRLRLDSHGPWRIVADPVRIEQIAFNVIENAIRYSAPHSTVVVRLRASRSRLLLVVENEVSDPAQANPERWFEMFQRGSQPAHDGRRRGLGIGLTVVQTLTAAHGGIVCSRFRDQMVSIAVSLPREGLAGKVVNRPN
ncbi:MAG: sensor histidine kinase, partial [Vicinamibacterales bacterium]